MPNQLRYRGATGLVFSAHGVVSGTRQPHCPYSPQSRRAGPDYQNMPAAFAFLAARDIPPAPGLPAEALGTCMGTSGAVMDMLPVFMRS